jgi:diguanylate cyclase (GGDEF)-like protein
MSRSSRPEPETSSAAADGVAAFPVPVDEEQRLRLLDAYQVLDSERDARFEDLVAEVAQTCGVPIATITFLDAQRQWFKASVGLEVGETDRDVAICAYTIMDPDRPLVIEDTTLDPRFRDNPLVVGQPGLMAYAGAPIIAPDGTALGTVCAMDVEPHRYTPQQLEVLGRVARRVVELLESGRGAAELAAGIAAAGPETGTGAADAALAQDPSLVLTRPLIEAIGEDLDVVTLVEDFCRSVMATFGWWGARVSWVQGDALQPGQWQIAPGGPETLTALDGRPAAATVLDDLRVSFPEAAVLDVSMGRWMTDRDVLTALGARHVVVIDVPGAVSLAARIEFLVPTARALDAATARTLTTAAAVLPRVIVQQRARQELTYRATHDALTGLLNREGLERLHRDARESVSLRRAVLYLDLDNFKATNDGQGHRAGDEILIRVARILGARLRPTDTVTRLGGDEFVVVLEGIETDEEVARVTRRVLASLNGSVTVMRSVQIEMSVSIGVVRWTEGPLSEAVERADHLMYSAKELGGSRAAFEGDGGRLIFGADDDDTRDLDEALEGALDVGVAPILACAESLTGVDERVGVQAVVTSRLRNPSVVELADALVAAVRTHLEPLSVKEPGVIPASVRVVPSRELWAIEGLVVRMLVALRERLPETALSVGVGPRTLSSDRGLESVAAVRAGLGLPLILMAFGEGLGELGLVDALRPAVIELSPNVLSRWSSEVMVDDDVVSTVPSALVAARALAAERGVELCAAIGGEMADRPDQLALLRRRLASMGVGTLVLAAADATQEGYR